MEALRAVQEFGCPMEEKDSAGRTAARVGGDVLFFGGDVADQVRSLVITPS